MRPLRPIGLLFLLLLLGCKTSGGPAGGKEGIARIAGQLYGTPKSFSPDWKAVTELIADQKMAAAEKKAAALLEAARNGKRMLEWAHGIIEVTRLKMSLHSYETAVRFLREQPWPKGIVARAAVQLYYAHALTNYARRYAWEIGRREKVVSRAKVDLKKWTKEQIYAVSAAAFADLWKRRKLLGEKPLKTLNRYLNRSGYPERIRGTLRDLVGYMFADFLADTRGWQPRDSNDVFRLDLSRLLGSQNAKIELSDSKIHPVQRLVAVLDDLESWHAAAGRREASLGARVERTRHLLTSFKKEADRSRIRADLKKRLKKNRDLKWWSMGVATLANSLDQAGDRVAAHTLAKQGRDAYPKSVGGSACTTIIRHIEGWEYTLGAMRSDAPTKRSLEVTHRNLAALHFRAWAVDLQNRLSSARDYNLLPAHRVIQDMIAGKKPDARWKVDLPPTPDFKMHRTFVTPPLERPGLYVVMASKDPAFSRMGSTKNQLQAVNFLVTNLVMLSRQRTRDESTIEATVVRGDSGEPVGGAKVHLYRYDWKRGHQVVKTAATDREGYVEFPNIARRSSHFLVAEHQGQFALDPTYRSLYHYRRSTRRYAALVYTDRSIYRPLQKIFWKVVAFSGDTETGRFETRPNARVAVRLYDPNRRQVVSRSVTTNDYGTASGEFTIPKGRLLGRWQVGTIPSGSAYIRVEEYKRPTFEAKILDPKAPLRLNKPAKLEGEVRYYFGLPVVNGSVRWHVTREPVYPAWYWWRWWAPRPSRQTQTIASGEAKLGAGGKFHIAFTPEADERDASSGVSYRYNLQADVTDEGGETRSASRSFRLGFVSVEASIDLKRGFFLEGQAPTVSVRRTDLSGAPRAGVGQWKLFSLNQPSAALAPADQPMPMPASAANAHRTKGDQLRSRANPRYSAQATLRMWADGPKIAGGDLRHGAKGIGKVTLPALQPGAYRIRYQTKDDFGVTAKSTAELVVASKTTRTDVRLPFLFSAQRRSVNAGGTVRLLALSGLPGQRLILERFRGGKRVVRQIRTGAGPAVIELPVGEADRGGFTVTLTAVRDHQVMSGTQRIFVPWSDRKLKLSFATFRDKIRPGTKEKWRVKVKDSGGRVVRTAELLAYMYDRSLDLFAPHHPPSPLGLYPRRDQYVGLTATVGIGRSAYRWSNVWYGQFTPPSGDVLRFYGSYAVGGMGRGKGRFYATGSAAGRASSSAVPAPPPAPAREASKLKGKQDKLAEDESRSSKDAPADSRAQPATELRTNFSETAMWQPHLLLGGDGTATIEFTVPDSVTSWNVWVHAITRDLRGGSVRAETRSVKDLMVRPYLPRFLREGDKAEIKVVVNNASDNAMQGVLTFDVIDPDTKTSLLGLFSLEGKPRRSLRIPAGGGANLTFRIKAPPRVGSYAFQAIAEAGGLRDGERRALPVLPSRMHLMQSRFTSLKGPGRKELTFEDMAKGDDPSLIHEQLVVTLDAQLFYQVLAALPYLRRYPYECSEQTLNRFVSSGIVSKLYDKYPAVRRMAEKMSKRTTPLETWDAVDPNRKMALEETPWVRQAAGGQRSAYDINVLDPRIAKAERENALARLAKMQTSLGAFPWFPGGPPSPYMTLYLLHGFAKAVEFGVDVPRSMVTNGWRYLARHYRAEIREKMRKKNCCWEFLTFFNYVASAFPNASWRGGAISDDERKEILDFSYKHWKKHSPYLKGYLALTLHRAGRKAEAKKVFASVMDSAKTSPLLGTYWAAEDRSWLWYNDRIETHAFALRSLMELEPKDGRRHGLVQWLLLNKKLNHWKSTRATAEVIYSLVHYLRAEGQLGIREDAQVTIGPKKVSFVFEPDEYTGKKNQILIPGPELDPKTQSTVVVEKTTKGTLFASATWHFSTEKLPTEAKGDFFNVTRRFFKRTRAPSGFQLTPIGEGTPLRVGDQIEVHVSLRTKHAAEYVHLRAPRAAGLEPEKATSRYRWALGIGWYEEVRDSGNNFFFERLPVGEYPFRYRLRANMAGAFRIGPATVQSMYAPEFAAYSKGHLLKIAPAK